MRLSPYFLIACLQALPAMANLEQTPSAHCQKLMRTAQNLELLAQLVLVKRTELSSEHRSQYFQNILGALESIKQDLPRNHVFHKTTGLVRSTVLKNIDHTDSEAPELMFRYLALLSESADEKFALLRYANQQFVSAQNSSSAFASNYIPTMTSLAAQIAELDSKVFGTSLARETMQALQKTVQTFQELVPIHKILIEADTRIARFNAMMAEYSQKTHNGAAVEFSPYKIQTDYLTDPVDSIPAYQNEKALFEQHEPLMIRPNSQVTIVNWFRVDRPNINVDHHSFYEVSVRISDLYPNDEVKKLTKTFIQSIWGLESAQPKTTDMFIKVIVPMYTLVEQPLHETLD